MVTVRITEPIFIRGAPYAPGETAQVPQIFADYLQRLRKAAVVHAETADDPAEPGHEVAALAPVEQAAARYEG
ncbi:MAG: hypothetical protein U0350_39935 [Caldilineaceae bacterium]